LNLVDDRRPERRAEAQALLETLERDAPSPGAARIGITGAPGAGKSTLLDALVRELRPRGETLAIVAVDPSSQRSGGALLGDRVRVRSGAADPGVFMRSMAARDRLGGLADATRASVIVLAAAFDRVFVETVGVGQSEVEVASLVDTLVYAVGPDSGDVVQFMKAGILEHPDVFAVTKSDLGAAATRTASDLAGGLDLGSPAPGRWRAPVIPTSARDGSGIQKLVEALDAHREVGQKSGDLAERRERGREAFVVTALSRRYGSYGLEQIGGAESVCERIRAGGESSATAWVARLGEEVESALRAETPRGRGTSKAAGGRRAGRGR
jgi:LAO/AO transport system kinase